MDNLKTYEDFLFNSADEQTGGEPMVFTDSEMKEYIKDGEVIKQN